ncbi:MAG: alanine racemase [Caldicoprobacterales bacterium]|nr:alanine racemase [Clostridiales bacterium]
MVIDLIKLENNIKEIKSQLDSKTAIMAIVKANAYGHGILEVAKAALKSGAHSLGVAIPEEGVKLRRGGIDCDILVLGGFATDQINLILDYNLSICLFSLDSAMLINKLAGEKRKKVKVHLKVDTGMGRIGVRDREEAVKLGIAINQMEHLILEGIFTHFSSADEPDQNYSSIQLDRFVSVVNDFRRAGIHPVWIHAANTASMVNFPKSHFNMVRIGIGIYGYIPGHALDSKRVIKVEPVLSWHTRVLHIKSIGVGSAISYGRTYIAQEPRIIATLPVGYGDGYSRLLSNKGWVLIRGKKAPIVGNICMDQMMVDVTDIPGTEVGDDVVLIGRQGDRSIFADDLAKLYGTISYEVLTGISARVPRIYGES